MTDPAKKSRGRTALMQAGDSRVLANMAFQIFLIRKFENTMLELWGQDCVHGPVHSSIGQEACAVGAVAAIKRTDKIASTHRAHHHYIAKLINYYAPSGFDARKDGLPDAAQEEVNNLMGEIMGLSIGCCRGRGGSMHLRNEKIGLVGTDAIVAGGMPLATGAAFAEKYNDSGDIVVCFLGDGAVNQGVFHESANLAAVWKLPVIYFIENNLYGVGTCIETTTVLKDLADKASAYGCKGLVVDGMNPVAVFSTTQQAVKYVRDGNGPIFVEAKCYRFAHHAGPFPGSSFGYRTKEEEKKWHRLDPHEAFPQELVDNSILATEQIERIKEAAAKIVRTAVDHCADSEGDKPVVKSNLWPSVDTIEAGLRSDGSEFKGVVFKEKEDFSGFSSISYSDAIAAVTGRWLEKDTSVFVLGEEVANFGGGPYGATKGLEKKYPGRVLNTPISEAGFTGLAGGAAMSGLRPVVEIMFPDFALVAADQLFNQIGKLRHMYGNTTDMPLVARTRIAIGCGYGGQHSMDPIGLFSLFSGWRILAPSNAFDYVGLFNSAMVCRDPVLIAEHHELYSRKFEIPSDGLDYYVRIGKARMLRPGKDVSVVCYSSTVDLVSRAAESLSSEGVAAEVIDLRTVSPRDIDYETIGDSLKKTGMLVAVEQAPASMCLGPVISHQCQKRFFNYLDGPVQMISALDIPLPVSQKLETAAVPGLESIKNRIREAAQRRF